MMGEPLAKQLGGSSSNGAACGVVPNFGSGWSEDMGSFSNCLNSDLIQLPNNGVRVTWSQLTNCPTVEHFDRNLVYSMYWSPDSSTWSLINSQTNNTRASEWMTSDVPAPYRTNGYYTVTVRESDWTGGGSPAIADWYYTTNSITFVPPDTRYSDGTENAVPGFRVITNLNVPLVVYNYDSGSLTEGGKGAYEAAYATNSWSATIASQVLTNYILPTNFPCKFAIWDSNPMKLHRIWYSPCYTTTFKYEPAYRFHEDGHGFLRIVEAQSILQNGGVLSGMIDYGNNWDVMGDITSLRLNSFYREHIGWIGAYGVRSIFYARNSGVYTISELNDQNYQPKAVKILRENTKMYSYTGTLAYVTNTFYYLDLNSIAGGVMAIIGTPLPYVHPSLHPENNWAPYSYWVRNYGSAGSGIMHTGDSFMDYRIFRIIQQTGPAPAPYTTNVTRYPLSVAVLSATATNATIVVNF